MSCQGDNNQGDQYNSEAVSFQLHITILSDSEINNQIISLNLKQRHVFDFLYNWQTPSALFYLFLSGSGRCSKSRLIKTIFHAVSKVFSYRSGGSVKPRVSFLAPTDVAAININDSTIHSGLYIPYRGKLLLLNDTNKAELRNKYLQGRRIVIDNISMVSNKLF